MPNLRFLAALALNYLDALGLAQHLHLLLKSVTVKVLPRMFQSYTTLELFGSWFCAHYDRTIVNNPEQSQNLIYFFIILSFFLPPPPYKISIMETLCQ